LVGRRQDAVEEQAPEHRARKATATRGVAVECRKIHAEQIDLGAQGRVDLSEARRDIGRLADDEQIEGVGIALRKNGRGRADRLSEKSKIRREADGCLGRWLSSRHALCF
jgi:hypothetical protein